MLLVTPSATYNVLPGPNAKPSGPSKRDSGPASPFRSPGPPDCPAKTKRADGLQVELPPLVDEPLEVDPVLVLDPVPELDPVLDTDPELVPDTDPELVLDADVELDSELVLDPDVEPASELDPDVLRDAELDREPLLLWLVAPITQRPSTQPMFSGQASPASAQVRTLVSNDLTQAPNSSGVTARAVAVESLMLTRRRVPRRPRQWRGRPRRPRRPARCWRWTGRSKPWRCTAAHLGARSPSPRSCR